MTKLDDVQPDPIDTAMAKWRQGDCVVGREHWFVYRTLNSSAQTAELQEKEVAGQVVLTQTCDVVRSSHKRPYVTAAPLVPVSQNEMLQIERGQRPRYAFVGGVSGQRFVADLDRIMTVEKSVVTKWDRIPGCRTDDEIRAFANALARKYARFAFPNDFTSLVKRLQTRLLEKHDKSNDEGEALRALREIRIRAAPSWDADEIELTFWFIRDEESTSLNSNEETLLNSWLKLVPAAGRFKRVDGLIVSLDGLTATDYVESDRLDLDHLSMPQEKRK